MTFMIPWTIRLGSKCMWPSVELIYFFLMIRLPPRSTLFPYTTSSDLGRRADGSRAQRERKPDPSSRLEGSRSEEHTSELQSRENLVCRLLLEKKKHNS